ncbi:protein deadpan isoform X2 [Episyrphus balteatus]|nr:protein deadpan isoform X2 [Episyrphus balteatus]
MTMDYNINSNSDDDFEGSCNSYTNDNQINQNQMRNPNGMSKAELRRSNKPIMEKRRRARINHCLNELKSLILEAMKKDPARHTKLEKADILEMTVKHLQSMQRRQLSMAIQTDPTVIHKFKTGFVECADEVKRYISMLDGVDTGTRQRLSNYLNNCANSLEQIGSFTSFSNSFRSQTTQDCVNPPVIPTQIPFVAAHDTNNNNGHVQMTGVSLVPSLLPSGEFALIMPNTNIKSSIDNDPSSFCIPNKSSTNIDIMSNFPRVSAFSKPYSRTTFSKRSSYDINVSVQPSATTTSPPLSPNSSISSHEDDSVMHTSSDFASRSITPPLDGSGSSFSGEFTTPSSSESYKVFPRTVGVLQQSHVTSSSEGTFSSKRLYPYFTACSPEEPSMKKFKKEKLDHSDSNDHHKKDVEEASENMWRPW